MMIIGRTGSINTANAILQPFPKTWGDNVDEFQGWCDTGENARGRVTNNCLISWYHGTRFANLSKYTWLLSSLHQKGECFKDWQVMVGPSQTPLGGAATIESAVRSVLSPRLAHKTGLNRQKIITFLSHFVDKATKQPTKQAGYYCIAVTFLLPTKTAERLQARDCCHAVTFLLPHRTVTFC